MARTPAVLRSALTVAAKRKGSEMGILSKNDYAVELVPVRELIDELNAKDAAIEKAFDATLVAFEDWDDFQTVGSLIWEAAKEFYVPPVKEPTDAD